MPNPLELESVNRFQVAHYPTDASGTAPDNFDNVLYTFPDAIVRANALMAQYVNVGVCTIIPVLGVVYVYPPSPLVDGFPA